MTTNPNFLNQTSDFLGAPITVEEFERLNLPALSLRRLRQLLEARREGQQLSFKERAQLEAFREAAFYLRMEREHAE